MSATRPDRFDLTYIKHATDDLRSHGHDGLADYVLGKVAEDEATQKFGQLAFRGVSIREILENLYRFASCGMMPSREGYEAVTLSAEILDRMTRNSLHEIAPVAAGYTAPWPWTIVQIPDSLRDRHRVRIICPNCQARAFEDVPIQEMAKWPPERWTYGCRQVAMTRINISAPSGEYARDEARSPDLYFAYCNQCHSWLIG